MNRHTTQKERESARGREKARERGRGGGERGRDREERKREKPLLPSRGASPAARRASASPPYRPPPPLPLSGGWRGCAPSHMAQMEPRDDESVKGGIEAAARPAEKDGRPLPLST
eukprot:scaffold208451_cov18-Tisochrysis_lutea.AAC.1